LSPLHFSVVFFSSKVVLFEPTSEGCDNAPSVMALAYRAYQLLLNAELALLAISMVVIDVFGEGSLYYCFGVTKASPH
jgi:hypothetical protein